MCIAALQLVMVGVLCAAPVYENASAVCSNTDVRDLAVLGYEYLGYAYGNVAVKVWARTLLRQTMRKN